jgi:hypothetical protein
MIVHCRNSIHAESTGLRAVEAAFREVRRSSCRRSSLPAMPYVSKFKDKVATDTCNFIGHTSHEQKQTLLAAKCYDNRSKRSLIRCVFSY